MMHTSSRFHDRYDSFGDVTVASMLAVDPVTDRAHLHRTPHDIVDVHFANQHIVHKQSECVCRTILALSVSGHATSFKGIAVSRRVRKKV
jgi:hypothetical protein